MVAEVSSAPQTINQTIRVERIVAAVDCGVPINPDIITAQIEGAIGFALSSILRNPITLNKGVVEQTNFDDYEPTRMREMPKVEVHIVKSTERPSGIGEPGVPPIAPAIGNTIFAATGRRLRSLPFIIA
jgi:isoquinoline 1-oxidoreductase subunit beta